MAHKARNASTAGEPPARRFVELDDPDGKTHWRLDAGFLGSHWTCIWGRGCQGIHEERRPELMDGCCSVGVILVSEEEAMTIAALAATMGETVFEHAGQAPYVERRGTRWATRVVDGACIFLNRPGFVGGLGCALHVAALAEDEHPADWKPQTCSRVPVRLRARRRANEPGHVDITVTAWTRDDWGKGGASMAWWCIEAPEAYVGEAPVVESLERPLRDVFGDGVYEEVRALLREHD